MAGFDRSTLSYRPCVGLAVFNREGLVLVASRIDIPTAWQMPQGGIDRGEDPRAAALRELEEEIGTANVRIMGECPEWLRYDFPGRMLNGSTNRRFRGQEQKWFAMRFLGRDDEIDLTRHAPQEFGSWRWVDLAEVPRLIVGFKRPVYEAVARDFARFAVPGD